MTTVFLDAVFKPFIKIVHDTGQQLMIDRTNFLTDGFLQIIQRAGFVSVNTRFQILPKEKITRWKIGRARGPRHISETGNKVPGKHFFEQWSLTRCSTGQVSITTEVANPEEKNAPTPPAYLLSTTHSKDVRFPWVTQYFMLHYPLAAYDPKLSWLMHWSPCDPVFWKWSMPPSSSCAGREMSWSRQALMMGADTDSKTIYTSCVFVCWLAWTDFITPTLLCDEE